MNRIQLESTFDGQAATYDQQWAKHSAFRESLHSLSAAVFGSLPRDARMLCVGAGTGGEIHLLATRFPASTFVAVEPSVEMVRAAMKRAGGPWLPRRLHLLHRLSGIASRHLALRLRHLAARVAVPAGSRRTHRLFPGDRGPPQTGRPARDIRSGVRLRPFDLREPARGLDENHGGGRSFCATHAADARGL